MGRGRLVSARDQTLRLGGKRYDEFVDLRFQVDMSKLAICASSGGPGNNPVTSQCSYTGYRTGRWKLDRFSYYIIVIDHLSLLSVEL